jgi:hypothetical protein
MKKKLNSLKKKLLLSDYDQQVQIAIDFIEEVTYEESCEYIQELYNSDPFSLAYKVILSPPHILPIMTFSDFSVEVIHWLYSNNLEMQIDNEDIHDHFGTIISKSLKNTPYKCFNFHKDKSNNLILKDEFVFQEGLIHIIKQDTIHKVMMQPNQSAISLRIVFPASQNTCSIYNENGKILRTIENSILVRKRAIDQILVGRHNI